MRQRCIDYVVYVLVRLIVCIIQAMPLSSCQVFARFMATLLTDIIPVRKKVLHENLSHAFPQLSETRRRAIIWSMWEHLILLLSEIAHAPRKIHTTNWRNHIRLHNTRELLQTLFAERPAVLVAAHFGNFELAGYIQGLFGFKTYTVARPLDNQYLNDFINSFRGAQGQHILPKDGTAQEIDRLLTGGSALGVLADHHAGRKGCWVNFFGRPASTHKAVAIFSLTNNAPLLVCYARRQNKPLQYDIGVSASTDPQTLDESLRGITQLTQWYTYELEKIIRQTPTQYWWIHRRWKDIPAKLLNQQRSQAAV